MNSNLKEINQVNEIMEHEMKFDSASNLSRCPAKEPLSVLNVIPRGFNNYILMVVYWTPYVCGIEALPIGLSKGNMLSLMRKICVLENLSIVLIQGRNSQHMMLK